MRPRYYPPYDTDAGIWVTDVTKPIYAPCETNYDAWIGYERKLTKKITWSIQLNVRDPFAKKQLIPIMANPDGTVAQVRIPSETTWPLTNTLKFWAWNIGRACFSMPGHSVRVPLASASGAPCAHPGSPQDTAGPAGLRCLRFS